jgi:hypothetical protein
MLDQLPRTLDCVNLAYDRMLYKYVEWSHFVVVKMMINGVCNIVFMVVETSLAVVDNVSIWYEFFLSLVNS